ncbi:hypothetical protein J3F83DRAFT_261192 [Trichoderma novae-zelandiae]
MGSAVGFATALEIGDGEADAVAAVSVVSVVAVVSVVSGKQRRMFSDNDEHRRGKRTRSGNNASRRRRKEEQRGRKGRAREMGRCKVSSRRFSNMKAGQGPSRGISVPWGRQGTLAKGTGPLGRVRRDTSLACALTRCPDANDLPWPFNGCYLERQSAGPLGAWNETDSAAQKFWRNANEAKVRGTWYTWYGADLLYLLLFLGTRPNVVPWHPSPWLPRDSVPGFA